MASPLRVTPRLRVPVTETDHARGPADAPVTLVQYGDFQCRYCGLAYPNIAELRRQRAEVVRLVYRHFSVSNVHPYAESAAEAAEAAGRRGRFWELHDWLYEHQDQLDPVHLSLGVAQLGLPADEVGAEVARHAYADRIRRDFGGGVRSGVAAAPALFVNDVRHEGGYALPELLAAVDAAATV